MLLIGESRFQSVSCGRNVALDNLCVIEDELQAALTNPLLRGLVDLARETFSTDEFRPVTTVAHFVVQLLDDVRGRVLGHAYAMK